MCTHTKITVIKKKKTENGDKMEETHKKEETHKTEETHKMETLPENYVEIA